MNDVVLARNISRNHNLSYDELTVPISALRPGNNTFLTASARTDHGRTFFAFERANSRLAKPIISITFTASSGFKTAGGPPLADNAVLLQAITVVKPRSATGTAKQNRDEVQE
ncbi:MAG: hypothetical protein Q7S40_12835 [Opitutaceae bacterium]|nr:hypothetical protein [Opitutaceae bacterium]